MRDLLLAVLFRLSLLFSGLAIACGLVICVGVVIGNRWHVGSDMAPVAERLPRVQQWIILPVTGYVLAIVCNLGTTWVTSSSLSSFFGGMVMLTIGYVLVLGIGGWFAVRAFPRTPWDFVASWRALRAEVQGKQDSATAPTAEWLEKARARWRGLDQERPGPRERRAERAVALLPVRLSRATVPARGLGVVRGDDGVRLRILWRQVAVWSLREPWWWTIVGLATTGTLLGAWVDGSVVLLTILFVVAFVLATVASRGLLILGARLHSEREEMRPDIDDALRSWEQQAPPPPAGADPVDRVAHQVSGCACAPAWVRLRLDDQHRATLSSELLHAAGLPPGADLLARVEGPGRVVLESPETMQARLQEFVLDGDAAPVGSRPAPPDTWPVPPSSTSRRSRPPTRVSRSTLYHPMQWLRSLRLLHLQFAARTRTRIEEHHRVHHLRLAHRSRR